VPFLSVYIITLFTACCVVIRGR